MSKAEERALEAYPNVEQPVWDESYPKTLFVRHTERNAFIKGYEQAEKDIHKEMAEIMEKHKEALHTDYDIHIEPAAGFDTGSIIVHYNDRIIEQLTWKDIRDIVRTADGLMYMAESLCDTEKRLGVQTYYEEILRRFKAIKEEK